MLNVETTIELFVYNGGGRLTLLSFLLKTYKSFKFAFL